MHMANPRNYLSEQEIPTPPLRHRTHDSPPPTMSSSSPPEAEEETPPRAADQALEEDPRNPLDGGTSEHFTQGEIVFATLLSFFVLLTMALGAYAFIRHRRNRKQQLTVDENDVAKLKRRDSDVTNGNDMDLEIADVNADHHLGIGRSESVRIITRDTSFRRQESSGPPRRGTMESYGGSDGESDTRRRSDSRKEARRSRRATGGSMGSGVSSSYKQAAIDHMNQITQSGGFD